MRLRLLAGGLATTYLTAMAALVGWAVLPLLLGWSTSVVESESMAPAVRAGDALVYASVDPTEVQAGQIVLVDDPAVEGRVLSHRVVEVRPDGSLVTRGDANPSADSTPVGPEDVRGLVRLRVPMVGLPRLWAVEGGYGPLVIWVAGTTLAVIAAALDPSRGQHLAAAVRGGAHRRRRIRRRRSGYAYSVLALGLLVPPLLAGGGGSVDGWVHAAFLRTTANPSSSFTAHPDLTPPDAGAVVAAKTQSGYLTGSVKPSATYRVHAVVTDTGNPASGTATVTADLSAITAGATASALTATASSVGGTAYTWLSGSLTAGASTGAKSFSLTMTDAATRSSTRTGYTLTVDGTAPTASTVDTVNKAGGTAGQPEAGDALVLTYSEQIDPFSILAGWVGGAEPVTVRFTRSGSTTILTVLTPGGASVPLGSVTSPNVWNNSTIDFTGSSMARSGAVVTVTLGTPSIAPNTVATAAALSWAPATTPYDAAGNAVGSATATEGGASDADF